MGAGRITLCTLAAGAGGAAARTRQIRYPARLRRAHAPVSYKCGLGVSSAKLKPDHSIRPKAVYAYANPGCCPNRPHSQPNVAWPYHDGDLPSLMVVNICFAWFPVRNRSFYPQSSVEIEAEFDPDWSHDPTAAVYLVDITQYAEALLKPTDL